MKFYTRWVHRMVSKLKLEDAVIRFGRSIPLLVRLLPLPEEYDRGIFVLIQRDAAFFKVDRSDYMQWHFYAGLLDLSWTQAASVLKPGCIVLDVGANCGQFSLKLAAALKKKTDRFLIHAFEPNPVIYGLLTTNRDLNKDVSANVYCHELALGKEQGVMSFTYDPSNSGGGSVTASRAGEPVVQVKCLDEIVVSLGLGSIDFIKIDVEGFEPEVLLGGEKAIRQFLPWLYVEITPSWFQVRGYTLDQIITLLHGWNYELWGEHDLRFIPYLKNEQLFRSLHQFNLLAKPPGIGQ